MIKKLLLISCLGALLLISSAFAGKGDILSKSASTCSNCAFTITNAQVYYDQWGFYLESTHDLRVDSDGKNINQLHVTIRMDFSNFGNIFITENAFTSYTSLTTSTTYADGYYWYNIEMAGIDTTFSNTELLTIMFRPNVCPDPTDVYHLDFVENDSLGYFNKFVDTLSIYTVGTLNNGTISLHSPTAILLPLNYLDSVGTIVDSSYVGGEVSVPINLTSNFHYAAGCTFTVGFDPELNFESLTTNSYSSVMQYTNVTDTSVTLYIPGPWYGPYPEPNQLCVPIVTANFTFDTLTAQSDTTYKVWIDGDYTFYGCQYYYKTNSTPAGNYASVKTIVPWAKLMIASTVVNTSTQNFPVLFKTASNVPLLTSNTGSSDNFRFTIDTAVTNGYSWYDQVSQSYVFSGSDTMFYDDGASGTKVYIRESGVEQSYDLIPNQSFYNIGYLQYDAGSLPGYDTVEFYVETDTASAFYKADNYVVVKYTNDTLFAINGDLQLTNGVIQVRTPPPPTGCPALYTWNGRDYILENTILTHSQGKTNPEPQDDYYPLNFGVVPHDNRYNLKISEFEDEITYLDEVELIVVDYPMESEIAISNDGQVFGYSESIKPIRAIDHNQKNILGLINARDDIWYESNTGGYMILTYENPVYNDKMQAEHIGSFSLGDYDPPAPKHALGMPYLEEGADYLTAEIKDVYGKWHDLGAQAPRSSKSDNARWMFENNNIDLGETFDIRINWKAEYKSDVHNLNLTGETNFIEHRITPILADKTDEKNVTAKLFRTDSDQITIKPGEELEMTFDIPSQNPPEGYIRKFFFKSNGYYVAAKGGILPDQFALHNNYPNPFNPSTTISYSLPVRVDVSLVVYNVLGQEVKTLHEGYQEAGNHQIVWGGDNNQGSPVASGVYFYKLKAGDFEQSKKMMLLK